jgi:hypothetical protein
MGFEPKITHQAKHLKKSTNVNAPSRVFTNKFLYLNRLMVTECILKYKLGLSKRHAHETLHTIDRANRQALSFHSTSQSQVLSSNA